MEGQDWRDLGDVETLRRRPLQEIIVGKTRLAVSYLDGSFAVVSGACNHVGGPLGQGTLEGEYVVCPWHQWRFHRATGKGEPGYEADAVPAFAAKIENGRLLVDLNSATPRSRKKHPPHPLARPVERAPGPLRVVGVSTTVMDRRYPRRSTSERLLEIALEEARTELGCEARLIRLDELSFRHCEGFYSKSARACTWPCSITQMDPKDQMDQVYEAFVHWADVILVATPIRWGGASSLYYKMVERCNCIQNQETIASRVLLRNKVAAFIITGGQDNVQGVAGQMLTFFAEVGCQFPQHPFIAHSRGWSAEDMENNIRYVEDSAELRDGARGLARRCVDMARLFQSGQHRPLELVPGGRKAHPIGLGDPGGAGSGGAAT
jgi:multimeric flavodoxin WrbA/nitrite reductase/ring-hydroxylating ferredoxin subunit